MDGFALSTDYLSWQNVPFLSRVSSSCPEVLSKISLLHFLLSIIEAESNGFFFLETLSDDSIGHVVTRSML